MKCELCKNFKARSYADLDHHIEAFHKLTKAQYRLAADAVLPALTGISMINGAMRKAGLIAALVAIFSMVGCNRLLNRNDDTVPTAPAEPLRIAGSWSGVGASTGSITINGGQGPLLMSMNLPTQAGGDVSGTWEILLEMSDQPEGPPPFLIAQGSFAGTIDANGAFSYTLTESPSCVTTGSGSANGNSMALSWTGNNIGSCGLWFSGTGTLTR